MAVGWERAASRSPGKSPGEGGPIVAQVCQVLLNSGKGRSWPETRLKVFPGVSRRRALLWSETAMDLTGVAAEEMRWCVWSIGLDGQLAVSEVHSYRFPQFKY